jgi:NAD(P)-dependent dehydrogenase (short-subunit alcohol dehydrogenase family)
MEHNADVLGLDGRVAIVTGAARGIGRAICVALGRAGCAVVALDRVSPDETVAAIATPAEAVVADVTDAEDVERAVQRALERFGRIDILVNNAGVAERLALMELDDDTFLRCMRVNVLGSLHLVQAVYPHMRARGDGRIVNVSSISSKNGGTLVRSDGGSRRSGVAYAATKGAIDSITQWIAREVGPDGIRCNAVRPGPIETELTVGVDYGVADQPIARMGRGEDVADAVVYLASDMAGFVTGQEFNVDGGRVMT